MPVKMIKRKTKQARVFLYSKITVGIELIALLSTLLWAVETNARQSEQAADKASKKRNPAATKPSQEPVSVSRHSDGLSINQMPVGTSLNMANTFTHTFGESSKVRPSEMFMADGHHPQYVMRPETASAYRLSERLDQMSEIAHDRFKLIASSQSTSMFSADSKPPSFLEGYYTVPSITFLRFR